MEKEGINNNIETPQYSSHENMEQLCLQIESMKGQYDEAIVILTGDVIPAYGGGEKTALPGRLRVVAGVLHFYDSINEGRSPIIITSGGFRDENTKDSSVVHSEIMKSELINWYEIPEENIIAEDFSFDTATNAQNVSLILKKLGFLENGKVTLITNQFHLKRATQLFAKHYSGEILPNTAEDIIINHNSEDERYLLPGDKIKKPYREFTQRHINSSSYKKLTLTDFVLRNVSKSPVGEKLLTEVARISRMK
jgi:hypothetical protein